MASSGGYKASPLPPIAETGIKGFLKWYQREQPYDYVNRVAPAMASRPEVFSDYNQSRGQQLRELAAQAAQLRRTAIRSSLQGLGQGEASTLTEQIATLAATDLTPVNMAADDAVLSQLAPVNIDTADAANTGAGTPTATTDWIQRLVGGVTSFMGTKAQIDNINRINQSQLTRAQQGRAPLNIGLNANGIPTVTGVAMGSGVLLLGGALLLFMLMGRRRAAKGRAVASRSDWWVWGLMAGAAYLVYRALTGVGQAAAAVVSSGYSSSVDAVSSGLYSLFGPADKSGSWTYYGVIFPDGSKHAVGDQLVGADGTFTWSGYPPGSQSAVVMQIIKDAAGTMYAIEA